MVSSVTPGPVSSVAALASPLAAVADGSSSLVEHAAAAAMRVVAVSHTSRRRGTRGTDGLDMVLSLGSGVRASSTGGGGGDAVAQRRGRRGGGGAGGRFRRSAGPPPAGPPARRRPAPRVGPAKRPH